MTETDRTQDAPKAADPPDAADVPKPRRRRGWISVYASAFVLMLASAVALAAASLGSLESTFLMWVSAGLAVAAIVAATASLLIPRP